MHDKFPTEDAPASSNRTVEIRNDHVNSRSLLGPLRRIWIEHASNRYELRLTRQGKLILTK